MDCRNCGAPMQVVSGQDYLYCPYCDSIYFPEESKDGVRVLGGTSEVDCPVCEIPLISASVAGAPTLTCSRCKGILCRVGDFAPVVKILRSEADEDKVYQPRPLNRKDLERDIRCPQCGQKMSTHPYYGPGNVVVDNCINCGLIWLDSGELYKISHAPGSDRKSK